MGFKNDEQKINLIFYVNGKDPLENPKLINTT
jgi:hypothetical protein